MSHLADRLRDPVEIPFAEVPGLEATGVPGHRGTLLLGEWGGRVVLVFAGRLHYYEGHAWDRAVQPVRVAHDLGARTLLVTNAAGGIRTDLVPGTLMALAGHLDTTRPGWWPDFAIARPYSPRLIAGLQQAAATLGFTLPTGVYAQLTGPSYETPAEIRALRACGADAVGMSTAREIQAARDLGLECAAVSLITNQAAGLSEGPIHHGEVLATAATQHERLTGLIEAFLATV
jgi:purine-nucleoside phosphorylase